MELVKKNVLHVVGIQVVAKKDYLYTEIPHTWNDFFKKINEIRYKVDNKSMDITVKKENDLYTKLVCVEVDSLSYIPTGMIGIKFPSNNYIMHAHKGSFVTTSETYSQMYKWAENNGFQTGELKIDYGYYLREKEPIEHTLYLAVKK